MSTGNPFALLYATGALTNLQHRFYEFFPDQVPTLDP
jgi:hypothetical protein